VLKPGEPEQRGEDRNWSKPSREREGCNKRQDESRAEETRLRG